MFLDCSRLIAGNRPRLSNGIAVADLDGDGVFELVVAGFATNNLVLKWRDGALVDIAGPELADPTGHAVGIAAADIDGDGREELYILNSDVASGPKEMGDRLFAGFGAHWIDLLAQAQNAGAVNRIAGHSVAVLDRMGEGRYGFVVATDGAPLRLLELNRKGRLVDMAEEAELDLMAAGRGLLCLPLLSERMDLFVCVEEGPNALFRNLGDGTFEDVAEERGIADSRFDGRAAVALDADGRFDLLVAHRDGPQRLYTQRTSGAFEDIAGPDLSMPARVATVIAADFDNDGHEELFFNIEGGPNRLFGWRNDEWQEIDIGDALEPKASGTGAAVADIDCDGRLELVIGHGGAHGGGAPGTGAPLSLYRPLPNDNGWIRVLPLTRFGAPARGAVVTCTAGGRTQRRVVCAGSGYLCQMEPVAHFGLGPVHEVERLEVRWPDGMSAVIDRPPAGRVVTVPYPPE
ncbi:CRTAC1 family protein [Azospirillum sp. SYSU D00513]|uniref:CRTAC1 family protein n=1 Tax=Azospirillum sp. SYSU D00513 TaxID=2812561 RepID=UPI001A97BB38|nr:CRTAC1 family protein [Azospirillum sp. SYSU D00513]